MKDKEVVAIRLNPMRETADIDESNNKWPKVPELTKFQVFKQEGFGPRGGVGGTQKNPMQTSKDKKAF